MRRREGQEKGTQKALDDMPPIERKNIQRQASRTLSEPIPSKQLLLPGESSVLQCEKFQKWHPSHIFFSPGLLLSLSPRCCVVYGGRCCCWRHSNVRGDVVVWKWNNDRGSVPRCCCYSSNIVSLCILIPTFLLHDNEGPTHTHTHTHVVCLLRVVTGNFTFIGLDFSVTHSLGTFKW